ncbi:MAG: J domain-containing protein [Actinomycetota bacterium]
MTPYEVLGVDPQASLADIRAAYLRRAREVHPDVVADADEATRAASEEQMRRLNDAWAQLSSPDVRSAASASSFTVGDDVVADEPIDLDDEPLGAPPSALARSVMAAGPLLLVLSVVTIGFGLLFLAAPLLVAGFIGGVVALAAFLMAPLLTMSSARHNR